MPFKHRIDAELVGAGCREEHVGGLIRPVEGECVGVVERKVLEYVVGIIANKDISHFRPSRFCDHVSQYFSRAINGFLGSSAGRVAFLLTRANNPPILDA
jgi:hypothetical protein